MSGASWVDFPNWPPFIFLCPTCGSAEAVGNSVVKYTIETNAWPRAWIRGRVEKRLGTGEARMDRDRTGSRRRIIQSIWGITECLHEVLGSITRIGGKRDKKSEQLRPPAEPRLANWTLEVKRKGQITDHRYRGLLPYTSEVPKADQSENTLRKSG